MDLPELQQFLERIPLFLREVVGFVALAIAGLYYLAKRREGADTTFAPLRGLWLLGLGASERHSRRGGVRVRHDASPSIYVA